MQGAYIGAAHLVECGHRQIGILAGFQRLSTMRERLAGFCQALQEHSIPLPEEWVITSPLSIEGGCEAMRQLLTLPRRPSAVFINNNLLTLGALLAMRDLGLLCPEGVSVVCFDDHPWAVVSDPPLTVVRQPAQYLGQAAAEMLFSLISDEQPAETRVLLECELVVRQSCCSP
jgi:DNA-binding LacI/PurR family transcriptional regulator